LIFFSFIIILSSVSIPLFKTMQQQEGQGQRQRQRRDPEPDHMFRGIYVGTDHPLSDYITHVDNDPHESRMFLGARDYIAAFPFTREYFSRVYPFYNGSKVSEGTLYTIYETSFITFVQMFKLNHPDWNEYSNDECIQHFIEFIKLNPDPTEYHVERNEDYNESHRFYYHDLNQTPPTHEKPHFDAYEIEYSNNGEYAENYAGSGYFKNANGEDVPFNRQMGIWGPNGMRRFHLYNRIALLERSRNGEDVDFLPSIQLRLTNGTPFDISIDLSEEKNHARFIENESDELFAFEESLQNEKRELRLAKLRQYEAELRQRQEDEALFQRRRQQKKEKEEKMIQFKNRASQKKIEKQRREKELFEIQMTRWSNFNASAYIDHPATIEMVQKFSAPLEPFVYQNLPIPIALPHEYRNPVPIIDDGDDDSDDNE
jgi:hypothetical protein